MTGTLSTQFLITLCDNDHTSVTEVSPLLTNMRPCWPRQKGYPLGYTLPRQLMLTLPLPEGMDVHIVTVRGKRCWMGAVAGGSYRFVSLSLPRLPLPPKRHLSFEDREIYPIQTWILHRW